jgi:thiol-disulfide isomerase/thioredoxin
MNPIRWPALARRMTALLVLLGVATLAVAQPVSPAATLKVGDPAPPLKVGKWVQGEPVETFEPGTVYVVEFWATWCGPCIQSIPHVSALQQKHGDKVVVIGQNVFEQDESKVEPFVKQMGEKMTYRVVMDDKSTDQRGAMASTWMEAAGRNGIPAAFIVDQKGKIAWIGHPMGMDDVLQQVVDGKFDPAAEAKKQEQLQVAQRKVMEALQKDDADAAMAALDDLAKLDPAMGKQVPMIKFGVLLQTGNYGKAYAQGDAVYEAIKDDAQQLNEIAWTIATEPSIKTRDLKLAEKFAARAAEVSKRADASILDTLARVQFDQGKVKEAIATQTEAVSKAGDALKAELTEALEKYKKADK